MSIQIARQQAAEKKDSYAFALNRLHSVGLWPMAYSVWFLGSSICHKRSAICEVRARLASEMLLSSLQTEFFNNLEECSRRMFS